LINNISAITRHINNMMHDFSLTNECLTGGGIWPRGLYPGESVYGEHQTGGRLTGTFDCTPIYILFLRYCYLLMHNEPTSPQMNLNSTSDRMRHYKPPLTRNFWSFLMV